jgi:ribonuclease-3
LPVTGLTVAAEAGGKPAALDGCQERLGYRFKDVRLLQAALTHASSANSRVDSNERMEFLGDAVLDLVICRALYERLPNALEGELTKVKSAVVSRRVCARVADQLGLTDFLALGQGMEPGAHLPRSLAAATLEAVIAAIYLDGGLNDAQAFIFRTMEDELLWAIDSEHQYNFKSQLQHYSQRRLNAVPIYELLDEKGPDHAKCFEVAVSVGARRFPGAWGPNKKEAEQKAARLALVQLGVIDESDHEHEDLEAAG